MLEEWRGGAHHMGKVSEFGSGVSTSVSQGIATYDFNELTRLVLLAHRDCIRIEINASGPGLLKICAWKRHQKTGRLHKRHPDLNTLVEMIFELQNGAGASPHQL